MRRTADTVVVGGGVVGASILYHLRLAGVDALLLERGQPGDGASGRTAGLIQLNGCRHEADARLTYESARYYRHWSEVVGAGSCQFQQVGYLRLEPPGAQDALRARVARDRELGWTSSTLAPEEVATIAPGVRTDDVALAAFEPEAGYADGAATARGFVERAVQLGAHAERGVSVEGIMESGGTVRGVVTDRGQVAAPIVIVAAGAWSASLLASVGLVLPIVPVLTRTTTFAWAADTGPRIPDIGDVVHNTYLRQDGENQVLIGVNHLARTELPDSPDDYNRISEDHVEASHAHLIARIPVASKARFLGGAGGPIGLSPDALPIIDRHPESPGLFFAAADVGGSFKTAPAVGRAIADWVTTGTQDSLLAPYGMARFANVKTTDDLVATHSDYFRFGGALPATPTNSSKPMTPVPSQTHLPNGPG
jgi:sarcosine oxidase subunit beta